MTQHSTKKSKLHSNILWNYNKIKLKSATYYPLHADSSWTDVYSLTGLCYQPIKITSQILELQILLLCDQHTCSNSNEHMLNSTKGITTITNFMITCPLNHQRGHVVSIPWDIIVSLLRIPIVNLPLTFININPIRKEYMTIYVLSISQSLLLISIQTQYPFKIENLCNILNWWIMTI